jgi:holo-[acyl-carrier protein] synthase
MIVGIGTDLLDVGRMARELVREGAGFRDGVFTPAETAYCESMAHPARHFAARFAAKEACWKALGGAGPEGVSLRDVEVNRSAGGPPGLLLAGRAKEVADARGVVRAFVTLSHTATLASACVVLEGEPNGERRS